MGCPQMSLSPKQATSTTPGREELEQLLIRSGWPVAHEYIELVRRALRNPKRTVGAAFGLTRGRGGEPASRAASRHARDAAILELFNAWGQERGSYRLAVSVKDLHAALRRYEATGYRRDLRSKGPSLSDSLRCAMFAVVNSGAPVPGPRQLYKIFAKSLEPRGKAVHSKKRV
ncbi:hypothetical protein AS156_00975 [Bradyrhizobium macuxiense]|uniref:Uncharacterized protein n=1 Tax=Bradyrhizobium macuxiense TaxID=1755647 RepID=A0A125Q8I6_9BRAD|nr:hypothetical protein AS156_00975 [Bradyrhizobium macuxiense]